MSNIVLAYGDTAGGLSGARANGPYTAAGARECVLEERLAAYN